MRLLRYNLAPTLNGLIASLPSHTTPWIIDDPTIDFPALYAQFSTFIMGRRTYQAFLSQPENPLDGFPKEKVVVFTRDGKWESEWGDRVTVVGGGIVEFVRGLKGEGEGDKGDKDIWLMGGGEVAGVLMGAGLVDVVEAAIMPVVVGGGVGMFGVGGLGGSENGWRLKLEKVEVLESGILMTRYSVLYG